MKLLERQEIYKVEAEAIFETLNRINTFFEDTKLKKSESLLLIKVLSALALICLLIAIFLGVFIHYAVAIVFAFLFLLLMGLMLMKLMGRKGSIERKIQA